MGSIDRGSGGGFLGGASHRGDPLKAADIQAIKRELRRLRVGVAEPLRMVDTPAGSIISMADLPAAGFWGQLTAGGLAAEGGAGAGTAVPGDANAGRYSFRAVTFKADGSVQFDSSGASGTRTAATGWAREWDGVRNAPVNLVVWLWPAPVATGEPAHFLFRFDFAVLARTKVLTSYPNVASSYYACVSQSLSGPVAEGQPVTITTRGDTFFAWNAGTAAPPQGTVLVCSKVWTDRGTPGTSMPRAYFGFSYNG